MVHATANIQRYITILQSISEKSKLNKSCDLFRELSNYVPFKFRAQITIHRREPIGKPPPLEHFSSLSQYIGKNGFCSRFSAVKSTEID